MCDNDVMSIAFVVVTAIVIVILVCGIGIYNSLVSLRNRVRNGWSQIDIVLKQRADLIPNVVETVKGYAGHESDTLTAVTQARAGAVSAAASAGSQGSGSVADRVDAENKLSGALLNLMASVESYPDLKANQNFMDLQAQLSQLEQKIAYARQFYNDVVQKYNTKIEQVPTNIIANCFHFVRAEYFEVESTDRQVPKVDFSR